jgi:hypothetical protein
LQRFQLLVWPDLAPTWRHVDRWPDKDAKNRAYDIIKSLADWQPSVSEQDISEYGIPGVRFTPTAQATFNEWREALEIRLRSGELSPALESHLVKYRSLMPSLALIFHAIECVDCALHRPREMPDQTRVGDVAAVQAVLWCDYLETHAQRLYASGAQAEHESAHALLTKIQRGEVSDGTTARDIYRHHWSGLATPEETDAAIKVLEQYGWVRTKDVPTGGRNTLIIRVHPTLRPGATQRENSGTAA